MRYKFGFDVWGLVLFLAMPLVLASPISFIIILLYIPLIAERIKIEEKILEEGLVGYKEYKQCKAHVWTTAELLLSLRRILQE